MEVKATLEEVISTSPRQTQEVAKKLSQTLTGGEVIMLFGNLGAGKTVFTKGIAGGLGIRNKITSPTFLFMKSYPSLVNKKPVILHHLDLYRVRSKIDIKKLALDEIFAPNSIVVIEWAENLGKNLPKNRIDVTIKIEDEKTRKITIDRRV